MFSSKSAIALAISLPIGLVILLLTLLGVDVSLSCGAPTTGGRAGTASGISVDGLSEGQLQLARNGVVIGRQRGVAESVIIAELVAQATESSLRNLANPAVPESLSFSNDGLGHDGDSVGPHQLRASVWGSAGIAKLMDPIYQINWFYDRAAKVHGSETMAPTDLAQAVEVSRANAYASQLDLAHRLYAQFAGIDLNSLPDLTRAGIVAAGCGANGNGAPLSTATTDFGAAIITAAQQWIGTPYVWGGGDQNGPTGGGFDCSGLTLYALYQASGGRLRLPHYTQAQQDDPNARVVSYDQRQPGDLIFFTASGQTGSHHVGIYYGRNDKGQDLLLHAPQTGETVSIAPIWQGERLDVRRYEIPATTEGDGGNRQ